MHRAAAIVLLFVFAAGAFAAPVVEIDLNGVVGDGGDRETVRVGDTITADLWFVGGEPLVGWGITLCGPEGVMEFVKAEYGTPEAWSNETPVPRGPGCVYFGSANRTFVPLVPPFRAVTVTYRAAAPAPLADLVVDEERSGWIARSFATGNVGGSVDATLVISPPPVPSPTWGKVKRLFR